MEGKSGERLQQVNAVDARDSGVVLVAQGQLSPLVEQPIKDRVAAGETTWNGEGLQFLRLIPWRACAG